MTDTPQLWHYTDTMGHNKIGTYGTLVPLRELLTPARAATLPAYARELLWLIWLTDLDTPHRDALGLTMYTRISDRTIHRYKVIGGHVLPWCAVHRLYNPSLVHGLESAHGALPMHWWVSTEPVPVVYDPVGAAVRHV